MDEKVTKDEVLMVHKYVTEPARVSVDYGLTLNLGNFESARIGVTVTVPCYFEEVGKAYEWASRWAEERVNKEKDAIRKAVLSTTSEGF